MLTVESDTMPILSHLGNKPLPAVLTLRCGTIIGDRSVKVVVDKSGFALYFSKEMIPFWKKGARKVPMMKQVCVIPFRRGFLIEFNNLEPTPLEIIESVDMLRVLEHGYRVKMVLTNYVTYSVDTKEDLELVAKLMANDKLMRSYQQ